MRMRRCPLRCAVGYLFVVLGGIPGCMCDGAAHFQWATTRIRTAIPVPRSLESRSGPRPQLFAASVSVCVCAGARCAAQWDIRVHAHWRGVLLPARHFDWEVYTFTLSAAGLLALALANDCPITVQVQLARCSHLPT